MDISNLGQLQSLPILHEFSSLRNQRDNESPSTMWKVIAAQSVAINKLNNCVNQLIREFKRLDNNNSPDFEFFPFKIYTLSDSFRPLSDLGPYTSSANWRTFRVRGGLVCNNQVSSGSFVNGTDLFQNYSDYNFLSPQPVANFDIQVPLNSPEFFFWIENSGSAIYPSSSYFLRYGEDPTSTSVGNPSPWTQFPSASANYIPIGWVDTATSGSTNTAYVKQLLRSDVLNSSATGSAGSSSIVPNWFYGIYNPSLAGTYPAGAGVYVGDGSINGGFYVRTTALPTGDTPDPVYPPPFATSGSGQTYWFPLASGFNEYTTCQGKVYGNFTNPQ